MCGWVGGVREGGGAAAEGGRETLEGIGALSELGGLVLPSLLAQGFTTILRPDRPWRCHTLAISASGTRSVSMRSSPRAARAMTCCMASTKTSRDGIPAVPRIVNAVLRRTAAGNEIVGPALSPTCTRRVSFVTAANSDLVIAASSASVGRPHK